MAGEGKLAGKRGRPPSQEVSLDRIAHSLARLIELKELELTRIGGLTVVTGTEEGEISYTDEDLVAKKEAEARQKFAWGLPDSASLSPLDEHGMPWGWSYGPEGAEENQGAPPQSRND